MFTTRGPTIIHRPCLHYYAWLSCFHEDPSRAQLFGTISEAEKLLDESPFAADWRRSRYSVIEFEQAEMLYVMDQ